MKANKRSSESKENIGSFRMAFISPSLSQRTKVIKKVKKQLANTNPWMSMFSTSPEKEKNSLMLCSVAPEERLPTFTDLICITMNHRITKTIKKKKPLDQLK